MERVNPYAAPREPEEAPRPKWSRRLGWVLLCVGMLLLARLVWLGQLFGWDFRREELMRWLVMVAIGALIAFLGGLLVSLLNSA